MFQSLVGMLLSPFLSKNQHKYFFKIKNKGFLEIKQIKKGEESFPGKDETSWQIIFDQSGESVYNKFEWMNMSE